MQQCPDNCAALRSRDAPSLPRVLVQDSQLSQRHQRDSLSGDLMDHKRPDKYGLQFEGRTEKGNPNPATPSHPNTEIAEIDCNTSTSRPLCLTASSRHLGETMHIINQPRFKAGHSKPPRRTSASSWQTGHSSKEATDFEEAPPTDHSAR